MSFIRLIMNRVFKNIKITFTILILCLFASSSWAADPVCTVPNDTTIFQCAPSIVSLPVGCTDADGDLVIGPVIVSIPSVGTIVGNNWEYTPAGDEVIDVTIRCEDALGGFCESPFRVTFVMNSPPEPPTCPPDSSHFTCDISEPITIDGFSYNDPDDNIDSLIIVIGIDTLDLVGSSITFTPIAGDNILKFICIDSCGEKDSCETTVSVTENSGPTVSFNPHPPNDTLDLFLCAGDLYELFYEVTDADDNIESEILGSGSPGTIDTALNRIRFVPITSRVYREIIVVTDSCGLTDEDTLYVKVTINSRPDVTFGSDQSFDLCEPEQICVNYNVTDNDLLDIITEELIDGYPTATIDTALNEICITPDFSGDYTIQVQTTDNCGLSDLDDIIITLNLNESPVADSTDPDEIFICKDTTITYMFTAVDNTFPTLNWKSFSPGSIINSDGELLLSVDTSGTYIVTAEVTDACDAKDTVSHVFVVIRNSAPIPDTYPVVDTFICEPVPICHQFEATDIDDPDGDDFIWTPFGVNDGTFNPNLAEWCFTPEESRAYQLSVMVEDVCGANNITEAIYNVTINSPPSCIVDDSISFDLKDPLVYITVPLGWSDEDYEAGYHSEPTIDLYGSNNVGDIFYDAGSYYWEFYVQGDDTFDVEIICTDSCGAFCIDTFTVIIAVNDPPIFSIKRNGNTSLTSDTANIRPDETLNLWVTAIDEDANLDMVFTINTDLSSLNPIGTFDWSEEINYPDSISGVLRVWPNTSHIGTYPVTFSARDNYNIFIDTTIYINVLPVTNLEFEFDPDSSTYINFREDRETILYYRAVDDFHTSDLIEISAESLPPGAVFQSILGNPTHATVTWTPDVCDHDHMGNLVAVALRAVNDSGDILISDGFDLIDAPNQKPVIIASSQWTITEEIPDTLIITRTDRDGECVGAPEPIFSWLNFTGNPNSGIEPEFNISNDSAFVSWDPLDGDRGDYTLSIEVDDQLGGKDTIDIDMTVLPTYNKVPYNKSFQTDATLRVNNPDGSITLTNYEDDQFYFEITFEDGNVLDTISIQPNFEDLNNNNITGWSWEVTVVDTNYSTGIFTWTPSDTDAANYTLSFIALDGETTSEPKSVNLHIIDQSNTHPQIFSEFNSYRVVENSTLSFDLWAVDIDSDDSLFKYTSFPRPPIWGNAILTPFDILTDTATFTWTPGFCQATDDSVEYEIVFTATDNDSLTDDTTINIWVIDAGNELAQLGIPSWDSISIAGNQTPIDLTMIASDRDCDRIRFSVFETSTTNTIDNIIPVTSDSIFVNDTLELNVYLSPTAEGLFFATLYIESDHNGSNWTLSDSLKLIFYVGDQVPPTGDFDPVIVSQCTDDLCSPVITQAEFSDIGSGIDSVHISYRQGNHVVPSQTKVLIPVTKAQTFNVIDTLPNELFTIYGLEIIYQSFDGANPPNSSFDTVHLSYDYHYDYGPTNAPYGRVDDFVPPTLRTLFYNDFSEGQSELNKWTLFTIPGIVDSIYLKPDSLFKYDINNYAFNETSFGWRIYKRSLWEAGESNGNYNIVTPDESLEHNQAYFYRRLDNNDIVEKNERLYIPHGNVKSLNEVNFDNLLNYSNKQIWRFIGNPFPFPISLEKLFSPSSIYKNGINSIYTWNWESQQWIRLPATGQNSKFNILEPYSGFICWPFNPGNAHLAIDPDWVYDPEENSPITKPSEWDNSFTINLNIYSNGMSDNLQFGFNNDADEFAGWEDHFKFTSGFEKRFINFGINNFEWPSNAGIYSGDYRPFPAEGEIWPLMIYSSGIENGSSVILNWNIENQFDTDYEIWLIDKYTDNSINMKNTSSYSFKQATDIEDERFEVITGTEYYLENYLSQSSGLLPLTFNLYQNYPNPFNPITTIKFDLPKSGEVELTVFNVLGQEVDQIFKGLMIKGEHTLQWDGVDYNGSPVASGTYFYRLKTGQQIQTKKMILIR